MSFGAQKSDSKQQATSSTFLDPTQTNLVNNRATNLEAQVADPNSSLAYKPYTGAGLSFQATAPQLTAATNYTAPQAVGQGYTAVTVDPKSIADVSAGQLSSTDLTPYMNKYDQGVIDTTTNDLVRARNITQAGDAAKATAAGAFGGSRSAVLSNLDDADWQRTAASTLASLRQQGFVNAQGAAATDIGNRLTADTTNQGKNLTVATNNQTATNQGLAFSADAANRASLANQQADLQAAQTRLQAIGMSAEQAQAIFGADWQKYVNSQQTPEALQQLVNQAFSLVPTGPLSTSQSTGSSSAFGFSGTKGN